MLIDKVLCLLDCVDIRIGQDHSERHDAIVLAYDIGAVTRTLYLRIFGNDHGVPRPERLAGVAHENGRGRVSNGWGPHSVKTG